MGHPGAQQVRDTAKALGITISGPVTKCRNCTMAKARQKNVNKQVDYGKISQIPGERLYMDTSSVKTTSIGGSKFWLLVVDEATDMCWSMFLKKKSDLTENMVLLINTLTAQGKKVKFIRCDNAGENLTLKSVLFNKQMNITFEITAPNSPQQNLCVKRKFATLYGRLRAAFLEGQFSQEWKDKLWTEGANYVTLLDNITVKYCNVSRQRLKGHQ